MTLRESIRFIIMNISYTLLTEMVYNGNIIRYSFKLLSLLVCVQYCIYFLYHCCRKRSMSSIVNSFVNDKLQNDQLIYDFVR